MNPLPMTPEQLTKAQDLLFNMTKSDNEAAERDELSNDLETFFYETREKFEYNDVYKAVTTEEKRKEILDKIQNTEEWTEAITKETTLEEMREKLSDLHKIFGPVKEAAIEYDSRADFI